MSHAYKPPPVSHRQGGPRPRGEQPSVWAAFAVHLVADIAAGFVGLWIVLFLVGADEASLFVRYVRDMAYWIAGWTRHIGTVESAGLGLLVNYVPPALAYLALGHGVAAKIRRPRPAGEGGAPAGVPPSAAGRLSPPDGPPDGPLDGAQGERSDGPQDTLRLARRTG